MILLCLQETWTIYYNINVLGNINNDFYLFTGISGVDHTVAILQGRPKATLPLYTQNHEAVILNISRYLTVVRVQLVSQLIMYRA